MSDGSLCTRRLALKKCNFLVRKKQNLPVKLGPVDVTRLFKGLKREMLFSQREEASFERGGC